MKNNFIIICLLAGFMCGCNNSNSTQMSQQEKEITIEQRIRDVQTIEEASKLIDGTTWHYTENLSSSKIGFWVKVSFNNGQATSYYANPSDGQWTKSKESANYQIEEGRYSNTGERYIAVKWKGQGYMGLPCNYALILDSFQLAVQNALPDLDTFKMLPPDYGIMEFGDYEWD